MKTTDEYADVLQNIESAVVQVWKKHPDMTSYNVMRAYDAAIDHYRAEARGHTPKPVALAGVEALLWEAIQPMCEFRLGRNPIPDQQEQPPPLTAEIMVTCLRRLRKSVDFWTKREGRQGYTTYIEQFIK